MIGGTYVYDHLMIMKIFTLIMIKIFIRTLKIMRKVATVLIWICSLSRPSHILGEAD